MTIEDRLRPRERHLDVHLRELRLPIGAQVLVAEALADLHVAVHARDHQDLLEQLRRLRQREELARVHAARHQVVARAFGRRLREDRRLDLEKAVRVEVPPDRRRHPVAQDDVVLQPRPAQIEIAVLEAHVFGHRRLVGDRKRRRLRLVQDRQLADDDFDLAGRELRVDRVGGAPPHPPADADDELRAQALGLGHQRLVVLVEDDLRDAGAIADVDEQQSAQVADAVHPPEQHDVGADVVRAERAAGVRARQIAELLSHVASIPRESRRRPPPGRMSCWVLRGEVLHRDGAVRDLVARPGWRRTECRVNQRT